MQPIEPLVRVTAALRGLAVGEAMGRATEHYRPAEIEQIYEDAVTDFVEPVRLFDDEAWAAGETGPLTQAVLAMAHPTESRAAEFAGDGLPQRLARAVATGVTRPLAADPEAAEGDAAVACLAAALAAACSGYPPSEVVGRAARAAQEAGGPELAEHVLEAGGIAQASGGRRPGDVLRVTFPPEGDPGSLIPFVLGIVYATQNARRAILEAVNQGGHAPETAALAGALCAAIAPGSLPQAWGAAVERVNDLDLAAAARRFLSARSGGPIA